MKIFSIKTKADLIEIIAHSVTRDMISFNVVWADGIRIAFGTNVLYVEEL